MRVCTESCIQLRFISEICNCKNTNSVNYGNNHPSLFIESAGDRAPASTVVPPTIDCNHTMKVG